MNKLIALLIAFVITGCATKPVVVPPSNSNKDVIKESPASSKELEKAKTTVEVDRELLKPCAEFSMLESKNPTPQQILEQKAKDVAVRNECARRQRSLAKIVRDAFNIPE